MNSLFWRRKLKNVHDILLIKSLQNYFLRIGECAQFLRGKLDKLGRHIVQKSNKYVREFDGFPVFYYNISTKPQNVITEKGEHI